MLRALRRVVVEWRRGGYDLRLRSALAINELTEAGSDCSNVSFVFEELVSVTDSRNFYCLLFIVYTIIITYIVGK